MRQEDLAELAGVSRSTVSRCLSGDPEIAAQTRAHVQRLAQEHGYVHHRLVRSLKGGATASVALIMETCSGRNNAEFIEAFQYELADRGIITIVSSTRYDTTREARLIRRAIEHRVDGIVIDPGWFTPEAESVRLVRNCRVPLVTLRAAPMDPEVDAVFHDTHQAGRLVGEHLCQLGHRQIGVLGYASTERGHWPRVEGLRAALAARGQELHDDHVMGLALVFPANDLVRVGAEAARTLLGRCPEITAVYCANPQFAWGVYEVAQQTGRRIPQDLSVAAEWHWPEFDLICPPLTAVIRDQEALAHRAVELLLERISQRQQGHWPVPPRRIAVPVSMHVGGSTGPPHQT